MSAQSASNNLRQFALEVAGTLREAGFEALWAGGCVRDELLGVTPKDYDVATNAQPDQIRQLFGHRRTLALGAAFGVITVIGPRTAGNIEVATFRSDGEYSDGRRPDSVTFGDAREDALRRDFTINGLFRDPASGEVLDFVGGQVDLQKKVIRAIGDPHARFTEDKLRLLRAIRFAATLDFELDPETEETIRRMAAEVGVVSAERIAAELERMLVNARRERAVQLLAKTGLLTQPALFPELTAVAGAADSFARLLRQLQALHDPALPECLALLLNAAGADAAAANQAGRRLRLSNEVRETTAWILASRPVLERADQLPFSRTQPLAIDNRIDHALRYLDAFLRGTPASLAPLEHLEQLRQRPAAELNPPHLIGGHDLHEMGLPHGPQFSRVLESIRAQQLDGKITTRAQALSAARKMFG